jgi:hypothetical protein
MSIFRRGVPSASTSPTQPDLTPNPNDPKAVARADEARERETTRLQVQAASLAFMDDEHLDEATRTLPPELLDKLCGVSSQLRRRVCQNEAFWHRRVIYKFGEFAGSQTILDSLNRYESWPGWRKFYETLRHFNNFRLVVGKQMSEGKEDIVDTLVRNALHQFITVDDDFPMVWLLFMQPGALPQSPAHFVLRDWEEAAILDSLESANLLVIELLHPYFTVPPTQEERERIQAAILAAPHRAIREHMFQVLSEVPNWEGVAQVIRRNLSTRRQSSSAINRSV